MRVSMALAAAVLTLPAAALAQGTEISGPQQGDWEFTLSGSGTSNNDFDNHAIGIQGSAAQYLTNNVLAGVRQNLNYATRSGASDVVTGATRGFVDFVFDFGRFRPYLGASIGGIYGNGVTNTFAAGPEVGFKYYAAENTFLFVQTEYQFAFRSARNIDDNFDDGQFFHAIGVGMNF